MITILLLLPTFAIADQANVDRMKAIFDARIAQDKANKEREAEATKQLRVARVKAQSRQYGYHNTYDANMISAALVDISKPVSIVDRDTWIKTDLRLIKKQQATGKTHAELRKEYNIDYLELYQKSLDDFDKTSTRVRKINANLEKVKEGENLAYQVKQNIAKGEASLKKIAQIANKYSKNFRYGIHVSRLTSDIRSASELEDIGNEGWRTKAEKAENLARYIKKCREYMGLANHEIQNPSKRTVEWGLYHMNVSTGVVNISDAIEELEGSGVDGEEVVLKALRKLNYEMSVLKNALEATEQKEKEEKNMAAINEFLND
jgi:hypothetical protein